MQPTLQSDHQAIAPATAIAANSELECSALNIAATVTVATGLTGMVCWRVGFYFTNR